MKTRTGILLAGLATLGLATTFTPRAQAKKTAAAAAPANAFQNDLLGLLDDVQKKILSLEDAIPQDKFKWRPSAGVRSVSEAFLHIAFGNYGLTKAATGKAPPAEVGFDGNMQKWDTQTTDKAAIKKILEASFEHVRAAVKDVKDADLDKKVQFFGHEMSERAVLMIIVGHDNEHMGQEVAYARANNVVPPWSMKKAE
ncbi:MAG TPA: DinB family protein [Caulobacteraceae bacterium]|nr:DinB family protein [Polyangia bacterium]HWA62328.1 DinB family protein [Caulobacteraceae bacterium]